MLIGRKALDGHAWLDEHGVARGDNTGIRVVEIALNQIVPG